MYVHNYDFYVQQDDRASDLVSAQENSFVVGRKYDGRNRRTTSLLPSECFAGEMLPSPGKMSTLQQLLDIEVQRLTCCVKIDSSQSQSRAGLLILRGRVLACVYGSKVCPEQLFGKAAYDRLLLDLSSNQSLSNGYLLSEEVALAAGSMFHNQIDIDYVDSTQAPSLYSLVNRFDKASALGAVALFDESKGAECVAFFAKGELLGIQSFFDTTKLRSLSDLLKHLEDNTGTKVLGSMISHNQADLPAHLTFSLSGLKPVKDSFVGAQASGIESLGLMLRQTAQPRSLRSNKPASTFVNATRAPQNVFNQAAETWKTGRLNVPDAYHFVRPRALNMLSQFSEQSLVIRGEGNSARI